jgi:putative FmdB family regulatory protein
MPLYEYRCRACGKVTEFLVRGETGREAPLCPECGGADLERLLSVPSTPVIKGGGAATGTPCGDAPCCGRETRCEKPPCNG